MKKCLVCKTRLSPKEKDFCLTCKDFFEYKYRKEAHPLRKIKNYFSKIKSQEVKHE